ncbi:MAG: aspartate aminotransferase family protein [Candidatus Dormibacteria bacterium]
MLQTESRKTPAPTETANAGWLARDRAAITPAYHRYHEIVASRGEGSFLWDVDGTRYLDFTSGIGVTAVGHSHPRVVAAAQAQLARLTHVSVVTHHEMNIRLAERLAGLTPAGLDLCFLANSGAEAVDGAIKLARRVLGRTDVIAFEGAFHGRTLAATSLTSSKAHYRDGYAPLLPGVHRVPYPTGGDTLAGALAVTRTRAAIDELFSRIPATSVAAILVEPVLGEGGYVVPPAGFLPMLREVADTHGILLVADEVQSGIGRTGNWFAFQRGPVVPDVLLLAKALGNGLPISAIVARRDIMEAWPAAAHGSTFGGNPVCCAAALATLDVIEEEELVGRAARLGDATMRRLRDGIGDHPAVVEVRGAGLMIGIEFRPHRGGTTAASVQERLRATCFDSGLLLLSCGGEDQVIRLIPPLNIAEEDLEDGLTTLMAAVHGL